MEEVDYNQSLPVRVALLESRMELLEEWKSLEIAKANDLQEQLNEALARIDVLESAIGWLEVELPAKG